MSTPTPAQPEQECPARCEAVTDQNERCPSTNARWEREDRRVCGRHQFTSHGFADPEAPR